MHSHQGQSCNWNGKNQSYCHDFVFHFIIYLRFCVLLVFHFSCTIGPDESARKVLGFKFYFLNKVWVLWKMDFIIERFFMKLSTSMKLFKYNYIKLTTKTTRHQTEYIVWVCSNRATTRKGFFSILTHLQTTSTTHTAYVVVWVLTRTCVNAW